MSDSTWKRHFQSIVGLSLFTVLAIGSVDDPNRAGRDTDTSRDSPPRSSVGAIKDNTRKTAAANAEKSGAKPQKAAEVNSPKPKVATLDKSDAAQAKRRQVLDSLIEQGVFQKIEKPGSLPRVWVKPAFYDLDFDQKDAFVGLVYSYYFDGSNELDTVRVFDSRTNREIGSYSQVNNWGRGGLELK